MGAEFDLNGTLVKDGSKMNLKSRGYVLFPRETLDLREARWNADVELVNFPATLIKDYVGTRVPIKALTGYLAQRMHVEGSPAQQLRLQGDIEFRQLSVDAPEVFLAPFDRADGRATFEIDWNRQILQIRRADFRAGCAFRHARRP